MNSSRSRRRLALAAVFALAFADLSSTNSAVEPAPRSESGEIVVHVVNSAGAAEADAAVSLFLYDLDSQVFKTMSRDETTDSSGIARHNRLSTDNVYYLVRARASDGLVGYHDCTLKGKNARRDIDVTVLRAVTGMIHVHDESGKAVPGASIRSMQHSGPNGSVWLWFESRNLFSACGLTSAPSNADGNLVLPELPAGKIDVSLNHPDFAPTALSGVPLDKNTSADATMSRGVKLTIQFNTDAKVPPAKRLLINFSHEPYEHPSTFIDQLPALRPDGTVQLTVAVGKYSELKLTHPEYLVTPDYSLLRGHSLSDEAEFFELKPGNDHFRFQLRRKVKVRGRVLDEVNGKPVADQFVDGELPSDAEEGPLARFAKKWTNVGSAATNDRGEFELELAAGPARLTFGGRGYISRSGHYPLDVAADGSTVIPDILVRPMPNVSGVVHDQSGKPLPSAIVRFRGSLLTYGCQPTVTDAKGQFELSPPWIPADYETEESQPKQTIVAFHPYEQLGAEATVRLDDSAGLDNLELRMVPQKYESLVAGYPEELTQWVRGIMPPKEKERLATISLVGKPARELDGAVWLNTDKPKMTLADFRGKYVLLQFWATWCGPCHRDMPNLKLADRLYKDKGLVVIGVHDNSMPLEAIKEDVSKNELLYPIVVDNPDGRIFATYKEHGMADAYPTYALIGPDGKVLLDDATVAGPKLNTFKIEIIRQLLMTRQSENH
jgi:thiol-disulfide isomerase/thioredoxin